LPRTAKRNPPRNGRPAALGGHGAGPFPRGRRRDSRDGWPAATTRGCRTRGLQCAPRPPREGPAMTTTHDATWLHENFEHTGSAFGLRIRRKLEEVQSPFQKIEMYESTDWGNVMLIDGAMMVTTRDNFFYHEMMAHA